MEGRQPNIAAVDAAFRPYRVAATAAAQADESAFRTNADVTAKHGRRGVDATIQGNAGFGKELHIAAVGWRGKGREAGVNFSVYIYTDVPAGNRATCEQIGTGASHLCSSQDAEAEVSTGAAG